jgi:sigma-B regulation protein RsbU (phosphoserine phosphatase)
MSEFGSIDEYKDLFENAPCGYLTIGSDGRITKVNASLTAWTGIETDKFIGRRLHQFLNMAGRIYYETHIAPLLRMQGFFNEFALDFETAAGERLPVIANAAERRDVDGTLLFTAVVVIKATDRRRYERQLVDSRSELQKGLATERGTARAVHRRPWTRPPQPTRSDKRRRADPAAVGGAAGAQAPPRPRYDKFHRHPHVRPDR